MIEGLKQDHTLLCELVLVCFSVLEETILHQCTKTCSSAQYKRLHDSIATLNFSYVTLLSLETDEEMLEHLYKFRQDASKITSEISTLSVPRYDSMQWELKLETFNTLLDSCLEFLLLSSRHVTTFNESPYSTPDVVVIGFDDYACRYTELIDQLYKLKESILDWQEEVLKVQSFEDTEYTIDDEFQLVFRDDESLSGSTSTISCLEVF